MTMRLAPVLIFALACNRTEASSRVAQGPVRASSGFLKGQLHAHSDRSGDGETPPAEVIKAYESKGYDFVVLTDHNRVTLEPGTSSVLTMPGVELTQNLEDCLPHPEGEHRCLLHVNALFVTSYEDVRFEHAMSPESRALIYGRAVDRALRMGGIAQLNHPNFHRAASASVLVELATRGLALVEIENEALDSENEGDATHPSTEAIWDEALTRGAHVFATATDDAHAFPGREVDRGFVMVRAEKTRQAIRSAIERGDFYASTGLMLDDVTLEPNAIDVTVRSPDGAVTIEVIGAGGVVLDRARGTSLHFDPSRSTSPYLRVRATDAAGRMAFTQPLFRPALPP